ncbi:hypothetical protein K8R33_04075 [archaeon]|nr:hypothetical protein [archaeon]
MNQILEKVRKAFEELKERDEFLLENDINERAITHKLAEYLQKSFQNLNVDCEYNRKLDRTKTIQVLKNELKEKELKKECVVYPDIIAHKRGEKENEIVIEVKKRKKQNELYRKSIEFDKKKLIEFTHKGGELKYNYGLLLIIPVKKEYKEKTECILFKNGKEVWDETTIKI